MFKLANVLLLPILDIFGVFNCFGLFLYLGLHQFGKQSYNDLGVLLLLAYFGAGRMFL